MADEELWAILTRFHREVFLPDFEAIISDAFAGFGSHVSASFDALNQRFDALHQRFHRLEVYSRSSPPGGAPRPVAPQTRPPACHSLLA